MAETNIDQIQGESTGKYGMERAMYTHIRNPDVLIGLEHRTRPSVEMRLYYLTGNIMYSIFPENFPKVITAQTDEQGRSFSVVKRVEHPAKPDSSEYQRAKQDFIKKFATLFPPDWEEYMEDILDFNGDQPNLLIDEKGQPVYVDRVTPLVLQGIEYDRLKQVVSNPQKTDLIGQIIQKTISIDQEYREKKEELEKVLDDIEKQIF